MNQQPDHNAMQEGFRRVKDEVSRLLPPDGTLEAQALALEKVVPYLQSKCVSDGDLDPTGQPPPAAACEPYRYASRYFRTHGLDMAAEAVLLSGWNTFAKVQRQKGLRAKRAILACDLAQLKASQGDRGCSVYWLLLTYADDALGDHPADAGLGRALLVSLHGIPSQALEALRARGDECRAEATSESCGWSKPPGFAEEVVRRFTEDEEWGVAVMRQALSIWERPVCPSYLASLIESMEPEETNKTGTGLERIAAYLCGLLPGCIPRPRLLTADKVFECDVVVRNLLPESQLGSDLLGREFLVECKDSCEPVGAPHVGHFLYRMRLTHSRFGIIFSRKGITGRSEDETAARSIVRRAFHEDGSLCVVVTLSQIRDMAEGKMNSFWGLVLRECEEFKFGRQISEKHTRS